MFSMYYVFRLHYLSSSVIVVDLKVKGKLKCEKRDLKLIFPKCLSHQCYQINRYVGKIIHIKMTMLYDDKSWYPIILFYKKCHGQNV